jgi:hypothetical protein
MCNPQQQEDLNIKENVPLCLFHAFSYPAGVLRHFVVFLRQSHILPGIIFKKRNSRYSLTFHFWTVYNLLMDYLVTPPRRMLPQKTLGKKERFEILK